MKILDAIHRCAADVRAGKRVAFVSGDRARREAFIMAVGWMVNDPARVRCHTKDGLLAYESGGYVLACANPPGSFFDSIFVSPEVTEPERFRRFMRFYRGAGVINMYNTVAATVHTYGQNTFVQWQLPTSTPTTLYTSSFEV